MPLTPQPKFFPVPADDAARLIIAVDIADGGSAALDLAGRILRACWTEERNIADATTLATLLAEAGLPASRLDASRGPAAQQRYDADTQAAIDAGVFGAPSYVIDGEIFWGQDRLDFVARRLGVAA
jgi:carboxymethylenebutenolidase